MSRPTCRHPRKAAPRGGLPRVKGRNVLVLLRFFGLLVRESRCWRWLCDRVPVRGPWVGETLHRVWVLVSWRVCVWPLDPSRWGLGRLCAPAVSAVLGHWHATGCATSGSATGGADERQRYRQSMTPVGDAFHECRMQFPRLCVELHIRIVGIATFVDAVESSLNRIACETAPRMCARAHAGPLRRRLTAGRLTLVHPRARGPANACLGPLCRTWARKYERGQPRPDAE